MLKELRQVLSVRNGCVSFSLCSYFLRLTIVKRLSDLVKEQDLIVHTLSHYPEMNNSIKMEVGIEDSLHIEFEYNKSKLEFLTFVCIRSALAVH